MAQTINSLTIEQLGDGASEATLSQFRRACEAAIEQRPGIWNWNDDGTIEQEGVIDFVWNDGDFAPRIRELLGEDVA